jgi:hypothetical protein
MESPLQGGYIGATATGGSHEASERSERRFPERALASEAAGVGRIAPASQISRKYRAPLAKVQEVLRQPRKSPTAPPPPWYAELLVRGVFDGTKVGRMAWRS